MDEKQRIFAQASILGEYPEWHTEMTIRIEKHRISNSVLKRIGSFILPVG
jgi:hypothetical protein